MFLVWNNIIKVYFKLFLRTDLNVACCNGLKVSIREELELPPTLVMVSLLKPLAKSAFWGEPTGIVMLTVHRPLLLVLLQLKIHLPPEKCKVTPEAETPE